MLRGSVRSGLMNRHRPVPYQPGLACAELPGYSLSCRGGMYTCSEAGSTREWAPERTLTCSLSDSC